MILPNKVGVIIQARMGSSRLPGKILKNIGQRSLLENILTRLQYLKHDVICVVATTIELQDNIVEKLCESQGVNCYRGSESDVLSRYYESATKYKFDHIVRLTADNPFVDIEELDKLIDFHLNGNYDYSDSFEFLPIGVGAEIFSFKALERSFREGLRSNHREHVNEYIHENKPLFKTGKISIPISKHQPNLRLTVDTQDDYLRACFIADNLKVLMPKTEDIIKLCLHYV